MKIHKFDTLSFIAGLAITAIGLTWLLLPELDDIIDVLTDAGSWFWPVVLITIGLAVLIPLAGSRTKPAGIDDTSDEDEER